MGTPINFNVDSMQTLLPQLGPRCDCFVWTQPYSLYNYLIMSITAIFSSNPKGQFNLPDQYPDLKFLPLQPYPNLQQSEQTDNLKHCSLCLVHMSIGSYVKTYIARCMVAWTYTSVSITSMGTFSTCAGSIPLWKTYTTNMEWTQPKACETDAHRWVF